MTLGNLPKELRRKPSKHAYVLLGYLPIAAFEDSSNASRRRMTGNLFHACMRKIFLPLRRAGQRGIRLQSGDGLWRRCHPILAVYVGDYPEQTLVACVKQGECPICTIARGNIGNTIGDSPHRDLAAILAALSTLDDGAAAPYTQTCADAGIKPIQHPFWQGLPYTNIYYSITPDILHQLYQGIIKHLLSWLRCVIPDRELNARFRRFPPNHHIRQFTKGITHLSRVTGREHAQISSLLLGAVIDVRLPNGISNSRLIKALRGILDFVYISQYPVQSNVTLRALQTALEQFHLNKSVFVTLGVRTHFNIPKLHGMEHYLVSIMRHGTTDNYNTEYTERLHIDLAKDAYRATNFKEEFPQMMLWLERREKMFEHEALIRWRLAGRPSSIPPLRPSNKRSVGVVSTWELQLAKYPSVKAVPIQKLINDYGAMHFARCLSEYLTWARNPTISRRQVTSQARNLYIPLINFPVYHFLKFMKPDRYGTSSEVVADIIHAQPSRKNSRNQVIPARFDTVLLDTGVQNEADPLSRTNFLVFFVKQN